MNTSMLSPRRGRGAAVTAATVAIAGAFVAPALAIPPGGPGENRGGATVTVSPRIVAPGAVITIAGSGFTAGQTITVKLDDGLLLPTTPAAGGADAFLSFAADGSGNIPAGTTIDLDAVRAADQPAVQDGSHRVRVLSTAPGRSIHADFAVTSLPLGPPELLNGGSGFASPPVSQLLEFPAAADPDLPYSDIPRLVAGSVVPFRFAGFTPGSNVTLKRNDGPNELRLDADASGAGEGYVAADTSQPGTGWIRFLAGLGGAPADVRSIRAPYAVVANTDGRDVKITRDVLVGGNVMYAAKSLTRQPTDYVPNPPTGQTFRAQISGQAPITQTAGVDGSAGGALAVPDGLAPGAYTALFTVGFAKQNDFPQAVFARPFNIVTQLPAATATLGSATALSGATVTYDLASFARNAGGGQKVAISIDAGAPLQCVDTDVAGDAKGTLVLPALPLGAATVHFAAGSECVAGGPVTQAPARDVTQTLTIVPPQGTTPPPAAKTSLLVRSAVLRVNRRKGTIAIVLRPSSERVRTTVSIRTQNRVKLTTGSRKTRYVTIARRAYTSKPGASSRTINVPLAKDGRTLLRRLKTVRAQVRILTSAGVIKKNARLSR